MVCSGSYCAVVCSDGFKSGKIWRMKCGPNNMWSHRVFSPCITCHNIKEFFEDPFIVSQKRYHRNLPIYQLHCLVSSDMLNFQNTNIRNSHGTKNLVCSCRKQATSSRDKICSWRFRRNQISINEIQSIECPSADIYKINPSALNFAKDIG